VQFVVWWCNLLFGGAFCCLVVQFVVWWCNLLFSGAICCLVVQSSTDWGTSNRNIWKWIWPDWQTAAIPIRSRFWVPHISFGRFTVPLWWMCVCIVTCLVLKRQTVELFHHILSYVSPSRILCLPQLVTF